MLPVPRGTGGPARDCEGSTQGRHGWGGAGDRLRAGGEVCPGHTDPFACAYGLVDGELKGGQGLSLTSRPPGTAVQAEAVRLPVPSPRAGLVPSKLLPAQDTRGCGRLPAASRGQGTAGCDSDVRLGAGWEHR